MVCAIIIQRWILCDIAQKTKTISRELEVHCKDEFVTLCSEGNYKNASSATVFKKSSFALVQRFRIMFQICEVTVLHVYKLSCKKVNMSYVLSNASHRSSAAFCCISRMFLCCMLLYGTVVCCFAFYCLCMKLSNSNKFNIKIALLLYIDFLCQY